MVFKKNNPGCANHSDCNCCAPPTTTCVIVTSYPAYVSWSVTDSDETWMITKCIVSGTLVTTRIDLTGSSGTLPYDPACSYELFAKNTCDEVSSQCDGPCNCIPISPLCDEYFQAGTRGPAGKQPDAEVTITGIVSHPTNPCAGCETFFNKTITIAPCDTYTISAYGDVTCDGLFGATLEYNTTLTITYITDVFPPPTLGENCVEIAIAANWACTAGAAVIDSNGYVNTHRRCIPNATSFLYNCIPTNCAQQLETGLMPAKMPLGIIPITKSTRLDCFPAGLPCGGVLLSTVKLI